MASNFILGLDIGTSSVKAALAEKTQKGAVIRQIISEPSLGLRRGAVNDLSEAVPVVARVLDIIRKIDKRALKNVYVNIGTPQVKIQNSKGIVAVSRVDNEIYQDDIDRVVKASQAINLSPNRMLVHNITREYIVDGIPDIASPLGLSGSRLEVASIIVDAFAAHVKSLMRLVDMAGGDIGGLVFNPLSSARAALTNRQRELGVALVDIGFGTTSVAVYEERKLVGVQIFPVGAGNITNDIAVGLKIPVAAAEQIKLHYGYALAKEVPSKEAIEMAKFIPDAEGSVSRRLVAGIIEARLAEILEFVQGELKLMGKAGELPGGVVFVGGGAKLPGLSSLGRQELKLATQIGFAAVADQLQESSAEITEAMEDPEFVNVLGLVLWGGDQDGWWQTEAKSVLGWKKLMKYFNT